VTKQKKVLLTNNGIHKLVVATVWSNSLNTPKSAPDTIIDIMKIMMSMDTIREAVKDYLTTLL